MQILNWLFGKKTTTNSVTHVAETNNLQRWKDSGQARQWVEAHQGRWDHEDWLDLLEELKRSPFWPMEPDAIGMTLEEAKREWLQRN